jgi:hypothetical protein
MDYGPFKERMENDEPIIKDFVPKVTTFQNQNNQGKGRPKGSKNKSTIAMSEQP